MLQRNRTLKSLMLVVAISLGGASAFVVGDTPTTRESGATTVPANDPAMTRTSVLREKLACAQRAMKVLEANSKTGDEASLTDVALWSRRMMDAELDLTEKHDEKLASMHKYCERMKMLEAEADRRSKRGLITPLQRESITYQRLEVEQKMAEEH